jgi:AcrR family transcriptional regulator
LSPDQLREARLGVAEYSPLPRGRHKLPAEVVDAHQRARLVVATTELFAERGFAFTAREVAGRARVSPSSLYRHFAGIDALLTTCFEVARAALLQRIEFACAEGTEAAVAAAVGFWVEEPTLAQLLGLSTAVGVEAVAQARHELQRGLASRLRGEAAGHRAAAALAVLGGAGVPVDLVAELAQLLPDPASSGRGR